MFCLGLDNMSIPELRITARKRHVSVALALHLLVSQVCHKRHRLNHKQNGTQKYFANHFLRAPLGYEEYMLIPFYGSLRPGRGACRLWCQPPSEDLLKQLFMVFVHDLDSIH